MSNTAVMPEIPEANLIGRPPKNKQKRTARFSVRAGNVTMPASMAQFLPDYLTQAPAPPVAVKVEPAPVPEPEPLIKDGFPNLPECKLIGRPEGSRNTSPRKRRAQPVQTSDEPPHEG